MDQEFSKKRENERMRKILYTIQQLAPTVGQYPLWVTENPESENHILGIGSQSKKRKSKLT
jgi:hypothetical protein